MLLKPHPRVSPWCLILIFHLYFVTQHVKSIKVLIDALINLGPNWNSKYNSATFRSLDHDSSDSPHKISKKIDENEQSTRISITNLQTITRITSAPTDKLQTTESTKKSNEVKVKKHDHAVSVTSIMSNDENKPKTPKHQSITTTLKTKEHDHAKHIDTTPMKEITTEDPGILEITASSQSIAAGHNPPYLVKDDERVQNFTTHISQEPIKFFESLKSRFIEPGIQSKIDTLAQIYRSKFSEFIKYCREQKIMTRMGSQKVILNTIDTSNRILRRLIDFLRVGLQKQGTFTTGAENIMKEELQKEENNKYTFACEEYNACRTNERFSLVIADIIEEILRNDDKKLKEAILACVEVVEMGDYSSLVGKETQDLSFLNVRGSLKEMPPVFLRNMLTSFKNLLVSKDKPLLIVMRNTSRTPENFNRTVVVLDIVDILDEKLKPTAESISHWKNSLTAMRDWRLGSTVNVQDIIYQFVSQTVSTYASEFKGELGKTMGEKIKLLMSRK